MPIARIGRAALALLGCVLLAGTTHGQDRERVPQEEIENTYRAKKQGEQMYRRGDHKEALPYLLFAAQRGFKHPQAQIGSIYVNGLGGVEKDIAMGIGWLGVAASGNADAEIKGLFDRVWKSVPAEHHEALENVIQQFIGMYDGRLTGVECNLDQRAGTNTREMRCKYKDEVHYPNLEVDNF